MSKALKELSDNIEQTLRMHQLNLELLEQLDVACGWILDNRISIPNRDKLASLLSKAKTLLNEIYSDAPPNLQHRKRTPSDKTEPVGI